MIKDFFVSFTDNIKEKTRNPFLGTYAIVWLIRNWYVVYMVFNFDKGCTMDDKLRLISEYFERHPFWENVGINILYTFGVLLATYVLLNLSRLIVNGFERNLTPWIYKVTDKSSIVTKDTYHESLSKIKKMETEIEKEKEKRYRAEGNIDVLEKAIIELKVKPSNFSVYEDKINLLENENKRARTEKLQLVEERGRLHLNIKELEEESKEVTVLNSKIKMLEMDRNNNKVTLEKEMEKVKKLELDLFTFKELSESFNKLKNEKDTQNELLESEREKMKILNEHYSKVNNEVQKLLFKINLLENK